MTRKDRHSSLSQPFGRQAPKCPDREGAETRVAHRLRHSVNVATIKARQKHRQAYRFPRGDKVGQVAAKKMKRNTPCRRVQRSAVHDMAIGCLNMHIRVIVYGMAEEFPHRSTSPSSPRTPYTGYRTGTTSVGTDHPLAWGPSQSIVLERKDDANWRS